MLDWLSTSTLYREIIKKRSPYMTGVLLLHENKIHCVLIYLIFIMFRAVQAALFCIYSVPSRAVNGSARPLPNLMLSSSISALFSVPFILSIWYSSRDSPTRASAADSPFSWATRIRTLKWRSQSELGNFGNSFIYALFPLWTPVTQWLRMLQVSLDQ